jgi:hypothetical protein
LSIPDSIPKDAYQFFKILEEKTTIGESSSRSPYIFPLHTITSVFLDVYTLLRMFKENKGEGITKTPVLNILYFGLYHTRNIRHLLTQPDPKYPSYSIDFYKTKKIVDSEGKEMFRCLEIPEVDISREIREKI